VLDRGVQLEDHPILWRLLKHTVWAAQNDLAQGRRLSPVSFFLDRSDKCQMVVSVTFGSEGFDLVMQTLRRQAQKGAIKAAALYQQVFIRPPAGDESVKPIQIASEDPLGTVVQGHGTLMSMRPSRQPAQQSAIDASGVRQSVRVDPSADDQEVDAIQLIMEDSQGTAAVGVMPYRKGATQFEYAPMILSPACPMIFAGAPKSPGNKKRWWQFWRS
jgi:hypothetical protein